MKAKYGGHRDADSPLRPERRAEVPLPSMRGGSKKHEFEFAVGPLPPRRRPFDDASLQTSGSTDRLVAPGDPYGSEHDLNRRPVDRPLDAGDRDPIAFGDDDQCSVHTGMSRQELLQKSWRERARGEKKKKQSKKKIGRSNGRSRSRSRSNDSGGGARGKKKDRVIIEGLLPRKGASPEAEREQRAARSRRIHELTSKSCNGKKLGLIARQNSQCSSTVSTSTSGSPIAPLHAKIRSSPSPLPTEEARIRIHSPEFHSSLGHAISPISPQSPPSVSIVTETDSFAPRQLFHSPPEQPDDGLHIVSIGKSYDWDDDDDDDDDRDQDVGRRPFRNEEDVGQTKVSQQLNDSIADTTVTTSSFPPLSTNAASGVVAGEEEEEEAWMGTMDLRGGSSETWEGRRVRFAPKVHHRAYDGRRCRLPGAAAPPIAFRTRGPPESILRRPGASKTTCSTTSSRNAIKRKIVLRLSAVEDVAGSRVERSSGVDDEITTISIDAGSWAASRCTVDNKSVKSDRSDKKSVRSVGTDVLSETFDDLIESVASVVIQTVFRQWMAKCRVEQMRAEHMARLQTEVMRKRNVRDPHVAVDRYERSPAHHVRDEYRYLRCVVEDSAAISIQAAFRGWWTRDTLSVDAWCATLIQKAYRGHACRQEFACDLYSVILVQSVIRRHLTKRRRIRAEKVRIDHLHDIFIRNGLLAPSRLKTQVVSG